jgi:hypothetical protein
MKCLTPITFFRKDKPSVDGFSSEVVPCGKCPACLARRKAGWVFRLSEELKVSTSAYFLTLTYSNENLPISENGLATLCKRDHQLFMKRLRKSLPKGHKPLRYYAVGEYGSVTERPHFHSILYNLTPPNCRVIDPYIERHWQQGGVYVGSVTPASIMYVAGYINKSIGSKRDRPFRDDRAGECALMSKGLGKDYLTPRRIKYYKDHLVPYFTLADGMQIGMPRYYRNKIYTDAEMLEVRKRTVEFFEDDVIFNDEKHRHDYVKHKFDEIERKNRVDRLVI